MFQLLFTLKHFLMLRTILLFLYGSGGGAGVVEANLSKAIVDV